MGYDDFLLKANALQDTSSSSTHFWFIMYYFRRVGKKLRFFFQISKNVLKFEHPKSKNMTPNNEIKKLRMKFGMDQTIGYRYMMYLFRRAGKKLGIFFKNSKNALKIRKSKI